MLMKKVSKLKLKTPRLRFSLCTSVCRRLVARNVLRVIMRRGIELNVPYHLFQFLINNFIYFSVRATSCLPVFQCVQNHSSY